MSDGRERSPHRFVLDNPQRHNALTPAVLRALRATLESASAEQSRSVVIVGTGRNFCSGYDLSELAEADESPTDLLFATYDAVERHPSPVVASIRGVCMGAGLDLALTCDIRIASTTARFTMPPAKLGIVYDARGVRRLIETIGAAWTRYLLLSAEFVDAETALRIGLVHQLCDDEQLEAVTTALTENLARLSPVSIAGTKEMVRLLVRDERVACDEVRQRLDHIAIESVQSNDHREALLARRERRAPEFGGT